ncbi:alpha/beta hydrolase [Virgibacillus dakarensis]|uniref:alpha/beta hydrolase n=1 Tax=Virgibacillus dakarensis TaxID=1917889 RepID=UPI001F2DF366|nr:DUF3887 domain-containing protein [Virgibacillus dakarensis]
MKNLIGNGFLILGLVLLTLSMPTTALGSEAVSQPSHSATKLVGADLVGPNLLNNIGKNSINSSGNDQVIDTSEYKNHFIQNAIQFIRNMQSGDYYHALKLTSSDLQKRITEQWLEIYWNTYLQQINSGSFIGFSSAKVKGSNEVHTNVELGLKFEQATVPMIIRLDPSGNVDDLLATVQIGEVAEDPAYSDPDAFTEKEVVVGKGTFALPGTLSIPKGEGPFPVVVLVQGSGASDRDERAYALKPFRDLAHGLASKGIAVLRYNKRTFEHTLKTTADPNHTVDVYGGLFLPLVRSFLPPFAAGCTTHCGTLYHMYKEIPRLFGGISLYTKTEEFLIEVQALISHNAVYQSLSVTPAPFPRVFLFWFYHQFLFHRLFQHDLNLSRKITQLVHKYGSSLQILLLRFHL